MSRPRQVTIRRLMIAVALFAGLFALPGPLAIIVASLGISLGFVRGSAAIIARFARSGPGRPDLRVNVPALVFGSLGLSGVACLIMFGGLALADSLTRAGRGPALELQLAGVVLGILIGAFAFVMGLTAGREAEGRSPVRWRLLAIVAVLTATPYFIGLPMGLMQLAARIFMGH